VTDRLAIGGNNPPRHEAFAMALDDVRLEAGSFLDGAPIETQGQADAIGIIVTRAKQIKKDADAARKEDKEPHLEAGRKVDADYRPVLETADDIISAGQKPLATWLQALEAKQRAEADEAREKALAALQAAVEAQRAAEGDVNATEAARDLQKQADQALKESKRADKAKPNVAGENRAIGLRSYKVATVTDRRALLEYVMRHDPEPLTNFLAEYAQRALPMQLPGVTVNTERKAA
jgi:hypothetical protein